VDPSRIDPGPPAVAGVMVYMHCGSLALLLAFAHTHAFTVPMMAAPRFSPSGSRLHMMAAGPEKSAFSLPPTPAALKLSGPAGSRTGFSCMPSAAAKRVPLRMAPASGYLESLNKGGSGGGGKQSGNCPICALVLRQIPDSLQRTTIFPQLCQHEATCEYPMESTLGIISNWGFDVAKATGV